VRSDALTPALSHRERVKRINNVKGTEDGNSSH
jgi:hypothetical protein